MGKLDLSALRYLTTDDFRVLTAIEMGMRNHEIVPVQLIESIAKIKKSSTPRIIANLLKHKLIEHTNIKYDGYSLNFIGYDFLAIHTLMKRGILVKMGPKLGVGKESDVYICYVNSKNVDKLREDKLKDREISDEEYNKLREKILEEEKKDLELNKTKAKSKKKNVSEDSEGSEEEDDQDNESQEESEDEDSENLNKQNNSNSQDEEVIETDTMMNKFEEELNILDIQCNIAIIKIARLGRTSFRAVKSKRDYVKNKSHYNWLYLSRLSAVNEYKFLSGLYDANFSVPRPYDHNRHCILMQYIPSYPLCRIEDLGNKEKAYNDLIEIIINLATKGLIHGDFNEFNILVQLNTQKIYFIDFPQMISIAHEDAEKYFVRDIQCINKFFKKKFGITFENSQVDFDHIKKLRDEYLDIKLKAYGHEVALSQIEALEDKNKKEILKREWEKLEQEEEEIEGQWLDSHSPIRSSKQPAHDDIDLEFDDEISNHENQKNQHLNLNSDKIEVDAYTIKMKVKRMLVKEAARQQSRKMNSGNRFKADKKGKIDI
jgi:RIO kinase 2